MSIMEIYDSKTGICNPHICRLCAEENNIGSVIFSNDTDTDNLSALINHYLPLRIINDGKFPNWICPGCHLQVETTVQFFDLVASGQEKLRLLHKSQINQDDLSNTNLNKEDAIEDTKGIINENVDKTIGIFSTNHSTRRRMEVNQYPKRKRGRPTRPPPEVLEAQQKEAEAAFLIRQQDKVKEPINGQRKRVIRVPTRFQDVAQGKELEQIYLENGVIGKDDLLDDAENSYSELQENNIINNTNEEIIGHLQDDKGRNLADLVVENVMETNNTYSQRRAKFICDICSESFIHEFRFMVHRATHNVRFECTLCLERFTDRVELSQHQNRTNHVGDGIVEIIEELDESIDDHMSKNLVDENNLLASSEQISQFQNNSYNTLSNNNSIIKNIDVTRNNLITIQDSGDTANNEEDTKNTPKSINTEKLKCDDCVKYFKKPSALALHRNLTHSLAIQFACSKCEKTFKHKELLQRHQLVHTDIRAFSCKYCGANFKSRPNFLVHVAIHTGQKNYDCTTCNQSFAHSSSLKLHMKRHLGMKPYVCEICGKAFAQKGNLKEHIRIHTGERPFHCDLCDKKFKTSSQYQIHKKIHANFKPHVCQFCSKSFLHLNIYEAHIRRHMNEKPFACSLCPKAFAEQWALSKHKRVHTGHRPYKCTVCMRTFSDCSNFKKHKKIHENSTNTSSENHDNNLNDNLMNSGSGTNDNNSGNIKLDTKYNKPPISNDKPSILNDSSTSFKLLKNDQQLFYVT